MNILKLVVEDISERSGHSMIKQVGNLRGAQTDQINSHEIQLAFDTL